jgi:hypothetical protein
MPTKTAAERQRKGPLKKRTQDVWANAMTDDDLKAISVPPERPSGESSEVVPFPGGQGYHHYHCWCDACLGNLVKRWNEFHPDEVVLPQSRTKKPVVPYT